MEPLPPTRQEKKLEKTLCDGVHMLEALDKFFEAKQPKMEGNQQDHLLIAKNIAVRDHQAALAASEKERLRLVAEAQKAEREAQRELAAKQRKLPAESTAPTARTATGAPASSAPPVHPPLVHVLLVVVPPALSRKPLGVPNIAGG